MPRPVGRGGTSSGGSAGPASRLKRQSGSDSWMCFDWWAGKSLRLAFGPVAADGKVQAVWRSWRFSLRGEAPGSPNRWSSRPLSTGLWAVVFGRRFGKTGFWVSGLREPEGFGLRDFGLAGSEASGVSFGARCQDPASNAPDASLFVRELVVCKLVVCPPVGPA